MIVKVVRSISIDEEVDKSIRKYSFINWSKIANSLLKQFIQENKEKLEKGHKATIAIITYEE